ncbi:MAG: N-acetylmuramoyl-L-alanine amidase [Tissierellia bacterium]|nr:N-acetylmuramoyl-L-alanine amidase [Tissierellia bacterium]
MGKDFHIKYIDKKNNQTKNIPLEQLVSILLAMKINIDFHIETLKAQAIILRTNILRTSRLFGGKGDIELELKPLEYYREIWKDRYQDNINKIDRAIKETKNLVITFENKLIQGKYHLVCGGSTENAENVVDNQVVYLRRVLCDYCKDSPHWKGEKSFTIEELQEILKVQFPREDISEYIEIKGFMEGIEKDGQGRVSYIKIGDKVFRGHKVMELLELDSTRFSIFPTEIKFVSRGKGHGLGLCQYGAEKMAQEGYTFKDILKYYYTGVEVEDFTLPCIKRPLFGKILVIDPGHGGEDIGHIGDSLNLLEKDIVLKLAMKLKDLLEEKGATVYLTRDRDEEVLAVDRVNMANQIYPDFFLSIHMDYYPKSTLRGCEIFHFRGDSRSQDLGEFILDNLDRLRIPTRGIREGNFYVFRGVNVSSLMIEIGYLSNWEEEGKFMDEIYVEQLAKGILSGILEYYEE